MCRWTRWRNDTRDSRIMLRLTRSRGNGDTFLRMLERDLRRDTFPATCSRFTRYDQSISIRQQILGKLIRICRTGCLHRVINRGRPSVLSIARSLALCCFSPCSGLVRLPTLSSGSARFLYRSIPHIVRQCTLYNTLNNIPRRLLYTAPGSANLCCMPFKVLKNNFLARKPGVDLGNHSHLSPG